jgi:hypothetical protein
MDQAGSDDAVRQRHAQRRQRQFIFHRAIQRPSNHTARVGVQDHREEHELVAQPDIGNIGPPQLIGRRQDHARRRFG